MIDPEIVKPKVTLLNQEQIDIIHTTSMRILGSVGVRIDSEPMLALLATKIRNGKIKGNQVTFSRDEVDWAIEVSPSTIEIFNRNGDFVFTLGNDRTRFGAGVTNLFYIDAASKAITPFHRKHMREGVRLADTLPNFDFLSTLGVIQDCPPHLADLYGTLEMFANTTKPLVILISEAATFPLVLDLLQELHGDLISKPSILPYFNPLTPLLLNQGTADKMLVCIERQLPFIYSSYGMLGASTPITLMDTLTLLNAEVLAGLTITQLIQEGAPIILGPMPAFFDMKTMVSFYDPLSMLLNLAFAELMAYYKIPHCGTSGSTTGWGADIVAAGEMMMNQITSLMGKVGLAPFVSSILDGKVFSPVNMVHADEIIANARRFSEGFKLDTDAAGLEEILKVGSGGSFLGTDRTLDLFRNVNRESQIFPRLGFEKWKEVGGPKYADLLRDRTLDLINQLEPPSGYDEIMNKGEAFIKSHSPKLTL